MTCPPCLAPPACSARNECCGGTYIPTDPAAPAMLAPWEWTEWLIMCK